MKGLFMRGSTANNGVRFSFWGFMTRQRGHQHDEGRSTPEMITAQRQAEINKAHAVGANRSFIMR